MEAIKGLLTSLPDKLSFQKMKDMMAFISEFIRRNLSSAAEAVKPVLMRAVDSMDGNQEKMRSLATKLIEFVDPQQMSSFLDKMMASVPVQKGTEVLQQALGKLPVEKARALMIQAVEQAPQRQAELVAVILAKTQLDEAAVQEALSVVFDRLGKMGEKGKEAVEKLRGAVAGAAGSCLLNCGARLIC
jgi:hypothetical protein